MLNPKMEYTPLTDADFWEDEGLIECHSDLGNVFSQVIFHRTELITGVAALSNEHKRYFYLAKKYFPNWIGFDSSRCAYNAERTERILRIRKVSQWKIDKILNDID